MYSKPTKTSSFCPRFVKSSSKLCIVLFLQLYLLHFIFRFPSVRRGPVSEACDSGLIYVYELPPIFNTDLLRNCHDLDPWHSRCKALSNGGLGPRAAGIPSLHGNLSAAWYWTDMFSGEVIYHRRILEHQCRTEDPESATAFYIPFYAGIAVAKYLFTNYSFRERDFLCDELLRWIERQPPWKRSNGSDHMIMLGRMTWDFRRMKDADWGSGFIYKPQMKRIARLVVEKDPWDDLEISVPYPTGFHPNSESELNRWLRFVQSQNRTSLFTFVGARRQVENDFRTILMDHCVAESAHCRAVDCSGTRCYDGTPEILSAFLSSDFCLQPRGDAYTRRSTFDCMLGGSIPVFFWRRSIQHQYEMFLGNRTWEFSVFIDRKRVRSGTSVRKVLESYGRDEVIRMREKVISLIPRFVYSLQGGNGRDAFDIAIDGALRKMNNNNKLLL